MRILLVYQIAVFFLAGCGFQLQKGSGKNLIDGAKTVFITDFANETFVPVIGEHARTALIQRIRKEPGLIYSNSLHTRVRLKIVIQTASFGNLKTNDLKDYYAHEFTIKARVFIRLNRIHETEEYGIEVEGNHKLEKEGSLSSAEENQIRLKAAEKLAENIFEAITSDF